MKSNHLLPAAVPARLIALAVLVISAFGCGGEKQLRNGSEMPENKNAALLRQVNEAELWFHAKKTRPIWARRLEQEETIETLEGKEQVPAGNYLCRGEAGDLWPQSEERLNSKYAKTDEVDDQGWRKWIPSPDVLGVMAAQIKDEFHVQAKWGKLSGKPGDFLVKNYEDRDDLAPEDIWIVDQKLFGQTYEVVPAKH